MNAKDKDKPGMKEMCRSIAIANTAKEPWEAYEGLKWPKNSKCYCESGIKYKKCCYQEDLVKDRELRKRYKDDYESAIERRTEELEISFGLVDVEENEVSE